MVALKYYHCRNIIIYVWPSQKIRSLIYAIFFYIFTKKIFVHFCEYHQGWTFLFIHMFFFQTVLSSFLVSWFFGGILQYYFLVFCIKFPFWNSMQDALWKILNYWSIIHQGFTGKAYSLTVFFFKALLKWLQLYLGMRNDGHMEAWRVIWRQNSQIDVTCTWHD